MSGIDIMMDGKYAYRGNPRVQVRVLCVDRIGTYPVLVLAYGCNLTMHYANGALSIDESPFDLVPLDETLVVTPGTYRTRDGSTFHVLTAKAPGKFPVIGYRSAPECNVCTMTAAGSFYDGEEDDYDLVERIGDLP